MDTEKPILGLGKFWDRRNQRNEVGLAKAVLALQNQQADGLAGPCVIAQEFEAKIETSVMARLVDNPSQLDLFNAKFNLQEEWQSWRRNLPVSHQSINLISGHHCIYEVYQKAYDSLQSLEESLVSQGQQSSKGGGRDISGLIMGDEISEMSEETTAP